MNIRNFKPSDYETICSWYREAQEIAPPLKHMPEETTFVILDGETPLAAISYFPTNVDIAVGQNVIGNPNVHKAIRKKAVTQIFKHMDEHAKARGVKVFIGFTKHPKLARRYQELGWTSQQAMIFVGKEL